MNKRIGVLSLHGTSEDHFKILSNLDYEVIEVQKREDLEGALGLIIAGKDVRVLQTDLVDKIKELAAKDFPIFGICSGMVLLSKGSQVHDNYKLGLMDLTVAGEPMVGRMETYVSIPALGIDPVKVVFLDAPFIQEIAPNVGILSEYNGKIVFVRQGNMLASAFYPEQTSDDRIHRYFLDIVNGQI